jgi:uncharacterized BrkB/YihY/UPF0761 family membrane protein
MDSIDITDSEFSLDKVSNMTHNLYGFPSFDYTMYIYISVAIIFTLLLLFLIYKYFLRRKKKVVFQDNLNECYGDVCPV